MLTKILRLFVILCIVCLSVYGGRVVYHGVYNFLDFQITFYKWFLQAGQQVHGVKEYAGDLVNSARDFLGIEGESSNHQQMMEIGIDDKIEIFAQKLQFISGIIGFLFGIRIYKILFSLAFGAKKAIHELTSFIFDD